MGGDRQQSHNRLLEQKGCNPNMSAGETADMKLVRLRVRWAGRGCLLRMLAGEAGEAGWRIDQP